MSAPSAVVPDVILEASVLVTPALRLAVTELAAGIARVGEYHFGWCDTEGHPTPSAGGKMLRPALALLSARAAGAHARAGIPSAVAVELVHGFSLLHDDVMDGDTERRHRPTAWTVFGTSKAILVGDALLCAAVSVLLDSGAAGASRAANRLLRDVQRLIRGQYSDLDFEQRGDVTLSECIQMAAGKTGALMGYSAAAGAELVDGPAGLVDGLARFGEQLGIAFQLVDDLLGIWGSPTVTGKPVLSDLRSRKKSLPVVAALCADVSAARELTKIYSQRDPLDQDQLGLVAELIEEAGGRRWAELEVERRAATAERGLAALKVPRLVRAEMLEITRFVTARNY